MSEPTPPAQPDAIHATTPADGQPPVAPAGDGQTAPSAGEHSPLPVPQVAVDPQPADTRSLFARITQAVYLTVLFTGMVLFFLAFIFEVPIPYVTAFFTKKKIQAAPPLAVELVKDKDGKIVANTLLVPLSVAEPIGIRPKGKAERIEAARAPTTMRTLVLPGSTALDTTKLMRIRARFAPAEVVEIATREETIMKDGTEKKITRELRTGDWVKKGAVLGIFYSDVVGSKKNDLIDATVQFRMDEVVLDKALKAPDGAVPEVFILNARRNVETDRNAIARAWMTLKTWGIPYKDIKAIEDEGEAIARRKGKRYKATPEDFARWARVILTAPDDGFVVERNVTKHEIIVDPTINLFQVAKLDRLSVVVNAPEEELPTLLKLRANGRLSWAVRMLGAPEEESIHGPIDEISYMIDVNQHAALVKGHIDNPSANDGPHRKLRGGQYVTATIQLPPPDDVVEVPMNAIIDDGRQCLVFVETDAKKHHYTMRRVEVTHRFATTAFVRSALTPKQRELTPAEKAEGLMPRRPLALGQRVLTSGALELKKELEDLLTKEVKEGDKK